MMDQVHSSAPDGDAPAAGSNTERAPKDHITLKWGTLKSWALHSQRGLELLTKYGDLGWSMGAMTQRDTPEQKELICQMIDECNAETIYLDWDGRDVSKDEAKRYVREYGRRKPKGADRG